MCAFTWVPSPRAKRPLVASASSHASIAVTIGLRGNASAIPVPRSSRSVASGGDAAVQPGVTALGDPEPGEAGVFDLTGECLHVPEPEPA